MVEACGNTSDVVKSEKNAMAVMKNGVKYPKKKQARRLGSGHDHWEVEANCHHDSGGPPKPLFTYGPGSQVFNNLPHLLRVMPAPINLSTDTALLEVMDVLSGTGLE